MSDETKTKAVDELITAILPPLFNACLEVSDIQSQHASAAFVSYIMDKATAAVLEATFTQAEGSLESLIGMMRMIEATDSLDVLFYVLRVVGIIVEKVPTMSPTLRARGVLRWVERMSNAAVVRQDVQAGLITSKSGRIKDKHISKSASDIMSKAWQHANAMPANTQMAQMCTALVSGNDEALQALAQALTSSPIGISVHELNTCDIASALLTYLRRPGTKQWDSFDETFSGSWGQNEKLDALIRPLVHFISTEENWHVNAAGRCVNHVLCVMWVLCLYDQVSRVCV
jgi:hypothetical protein